jgi:hypothetical protein
MQRFDGKTVIVVGRSAFTDEGSWLSEECEQQIVAGGREFRPLISTSYSVSRVAPPPQKPKGFAWDERVLQQKLEQLKRTTSLRVYKELNYTDQWRAVFGRLETQPPGFGHLGAAPAQLISPADGSRALERQY